jgi:hypothetical protein
LGSPDQSILNRMITILDSKIEVLEILLVSDLSIPLLLCVALFELESTSGPLLKVGSWCSREHQSGR